jgi:hypothetical protein
VDSPRSRTLQLGHAIGESTHREHLTKLKTDLLLKASFGCHLIEIIAVSSGTFRRYGLAHTSNTHQLRVRRSQTSQRTSAIVAKTHRKLLPHAFYPVSCGMIQRYRPPQSQLNCRIFRLSPLPLRVKREPSTDCAALDPCCLHVRAASACSSTSCPIYWDFAPCVNLLVACPLPPGGSA